MGCDTGTCVDPAKNHWTGIGRGLDGDWTGIALCRCLMRYQRNCTEDDSVWDARSYGLSMEIIIYLGSLGIKNEEIPRVGILGAQEIQKPCTKSTMPEQDALQKLKVPTANRQRSRGLAPQRYGTWDGGQVSGPGSPWSRAPFSRRRATECGEPLKSCGTNSSVPLEMRGLWQMIGF